MSSKVHQLAAIFSVT